MMDHHQSKNLIQLPDNHPVWVDMAPHDQVSGNIVSRAPEARSHVNPQSTLARISNYM